MYHLYMGILHRYVELVITDIKFVAAQVYQYKLLPTKNHLMALVYMFFNLDNHNYS